MSTTTPNYGWTLPGVNDPADSNIWGTELNNNLTSQDTTVKSISDVANTGAPLIGEMRVKAGQTIPSGWLLCYGQSVSRTTYATLFAEIGIAWGAGDTSTTFNVPDMRGRAPFGVDNMGGAAANRVTFAVSGITGSTLGSVGGDQQPSAHTIASVVTDPGHRHGQTNNNLNSVSNNGLGSSVIGTNITSSGATIKQDLTLTATTGITVASTDNATGTAANMPPAAMCYYVIYSGV